MTAHRITVEESSPGRFRSVCDCGKYRSRTYVYRPAAQSAGEQHLHSAQQEGAGRMIANRPFILPSDERPEDFLTVTDSHGASINLERDPDDGVVSVWIAQPGENDGYPVLLGEGSKELIASFLAGDR